MSHQDVFGQYSGYYYYDFNIYANYYNYNYYGYYYDDDYDDDDDDDDYDDVIDDEHQSGEMFEYTDGSLRANCTFCAGGERRVNEDTCETCPANTFAPEPKGSGALECFPCPPGFTSTAGATSCQPTQKPTSTPTQIPTQTKEKDENDDRAIPRVRKSINSSLFLYSSTSFFFSPTKKI